MKIFIELPKEIKNILVDPCELKEDIRYSAILGLQYCLALKLLNYLGTAKSYRGQNQAGFKRQNSHTLWSYLWSYLHTDLSGRIIGWRRASNPWFSLLLNCIPNRHHCSSHFLQNYEGNKATKIDHWVVDVLIATSWVNYLISSGLTLYVKWE